MDERKITVTSDPHKIIAELLDDESLGIIQREIYRSEGNPNYEPRIDDCRLLAIYWLVQVSDY